MKYLNEPELVSLLKSNDRVAFEYLYYHYSGALYGVIKKIVQDEHAASDVMQDTFLKIWKSIQSYDQDRGSLFTWMLNIARHRAIDALRAKARSIPTIEITGLQNEEELYCYASLPLLDLYDIRQLINQLNPDKKQLIDLVYIQGFTQEEVSQTLLIPLGTIKSRTRKAIAQLRVLFEVSGHLVPHT